ncbi:beta-N-acetylhexosaminidase [Actinomadura nitritigenes]|uniref:beta-N-acetylhexosaminidase n=1 Tax=Actinomadura nitritigenes TaxID=134602 RepID=A0ABS3RF38_9ACTN|nr:beta-N-acetylhexosaminidase [Actinomadura nitritigenes]MBO2444861.1 beta-N-acetylhexosaminidase [Actinomadura nitritigenes]
MVIPKPVSLDTRPGRLVLDRHTTLTADLALAEVAAWLRGELSTVTGGELPSGPRPGGITLAVREMPPEAYRLSVDAGGALIEAGDGAGAFHGAQTLRQLLPPEAYRKAAAGRSLPLPHVRIEDRPRFAWRGCLLDVARNFLPKADLLRFIDLMALHKLNILHLHLTDDQGWRLEIRRYPRLTGVGAWRRESQVGWNGPGDGRPHGGYYSQDDVREIVAYAAQRHITVVPEIDLPGHTQAAIAAHPELGNLDTPLDVATTWGVGPNVLNAEEHTIAFFQNVLDEVVELFPSPYISIGGDECRKDQWRASPAAQRRIRELGLRDEADLQSWIIGRIAGHLAAHGRRTVGWDEILEGRGAPEHTVITSWRDDHGTVVAAKSGHDVVPCPNTSVYLDYRQAPGDQEPVPFGTVLTVDDVYAFEPIPPALAGDRAARHILGAQCCLWTELIDSPRQLDYMAFPRLAAFAETVWSTEDRDPAGFRRRLGAHLDRLAALGVEYRPEAGPLPWQRRPGVAGRPEEDDAWQAKVSEWTRPLREGR